MTDTRCHRHPDHRRPCRECAAARPAVIQAAYDALHAARRRAPVTYQPEPLDLEVDQ